MPQLLREPRLADYHLHTKRCGHAHGELSDYIERALELRLAEIGFADHLPLFGKIDPSLTMSWEELPDYVRSVEESAKAYPALTIRLGIEIDYLPDREDGLRRVLADYRFDYVLGSVHFVDGWGIDDRRYLDRYADYDINDLYGKYFGLVQRAARSGLCDVMAHADLIKKYNKRPTIDPASWYEETALAMAEAGVALEVSSAGLRKPVREIYPAEDLLRLCRRHGVPVTLGSDAHRAGEVGKDFDLLVDALTAAGYAEIAVFEKRERQALPLGG